MLVLAERRHSISSCWCYAIDELILKIWKCLYFSPFHYKWQMSSNINSACNSKVKIMTWHWIVEERFCLIFSGYLCHRNAISLSHLLVKVGIVIILSEQGIMNKKKGFVCWIIALHWIMHCSFLLIVQCGRITWECEDTE